ncbi:MAG TPA: zinc-ribbon domain-containing protein, partial [Phycisphaerae bacterium]|nr:zinc-ribbon domain-containing protein [Phycisphaerae bacterium]
MAANEELRVRCPSCGTKYKLPAKAVGRKVRCVKCNTTFRITDPRADSHRFPSASKPDASRPAAPQPAPPQREHQRFPTEEDILRWLSEAD